MLWRVEVKQREGVFDALGQEVCHNIAGLGISSIKSVDVVQVYNIDGDLKEAQLKKICEKLLTNPVTQEYSYFKENSPKDKKGRQTHLVEIAYNTGVMDPVEASTIKGIEDLGIKQINSVTTAKRYFLHGKISKSQLDLITEKALSNKLIQHTVTDFSYKPLVKKDSIPSECHLIQVDMVDANDRQLMKLSSEGQLFLNIEEMQTIRKHFKKLKRNPTDCELETIAQTWSEHCFHKTFRGNIEYKEAGKKPKLIRNLLKSTIAKATKEINKSWCVSVFVDNAGVIKFDKDSNVCFKVETHNHPSALEPFGGANTGIGGVIRDILGTGLGAKPICSTDVFCFAPPDMSFDELPPGTLHPKRVMKGVVSGVRDYGNKMGIPTVNGAVIFDKHFVGNPLVYCGNVGIMPKDKVKKKANKGDLIVTVGGKTGRDGIHGATFSSGELTDESEVVSSGAVQIGNPIEEKKVLDALLKARDANLYSMITDCGAGGFSSAVGEMGEELGARVDLEKAPLKYQGLSYTEIWISESQERMVIAVPPKNEKRLLEVFAEENVEATVIGEFTGSKRLELFFNGCQVCDLDMEFLHDGHPRGIKKAKWTPPKSAHPKIKPPQDLTRHLKNALSHYNVCSKEWIVRQYDHEVQGASVIKPFVGIDCDGPSDASVVAPKLGSTKGVAVSNGINIRYGMIDPYWMAASCIDEAIRQIISVGGSLEKIAILDNFCWGNPDKPDRLGSLVRAAQGCYKIATGYQVPFISGKDSLYNEYTDGKKSIAIPGTLLISAIGIVDNVTKAVTMDFKKDGNLIYVVGKTFDELGGSIYLDTLGFLGASVPTVNTKKGTKTFMALSRAVSKKLVRSIHDCSEGGIGVAVAEMAFSGGLGAHIDLDKVPYKGKSRRDDTILFSESNSRFVVEVEPKNQKKFEKLLKGVVYNRIGCVEKREDLIIKGLDGSVCVDASIQELKEAWQSPINW